MYIGKISEMYLVTKVDVKNGTTEVVGFFRSKDNADAFIEGHASGEFEWTCNMVVTDF